MGGATCAAGLAPTGARILILERGARLRDSADARDARAIFQRGVFRPDETWLDGAGQPFNPGNYYYVGGNSKLYGAVLFRYRERDFEPVVYRDGATPGWPFSYDELEPWYWLAEKLYNVRGAVGFDPTEPRASRPIRSALSRTSRRSREVRERLKRVGLHPFPLPLGVDVDKWLKRAKTPWDAFPDTGTGKMDAETCGLSKALAHPNVELRENARVERLLVGPDGKRVTGVEALIAGERRRISARIVILAAGAVNSAALLLASRESGIANRSDAVGRHFMNHNCSAVLAIDPAYGQRLRLPEDARHQRLLPRRRPRRAAARQHPAAWPGDRANPEGKPSESAGVGSRSHEQALSRLVRDERGRAEPGKPRDGGRRADPARLAAQQLERT